MSDIFISYAREDRPRAQKLARMLQQNGWSVWWDRNIRVGESFPRVIEEALDAARAVIVLWSRHSVASDWVRDEADEARKGEKLVPVLVDESAIPLGFRQIETLPLNSGRRGFDREAVQGLIAELREKLRASTPPPKASDGSPTTGALTKARLDLLCPVLAIRGKAMIELCEHERISVLVTQGLRTWEEQDALYARGRSSPPVGKQYVITNAKGGHSFHNFGLAFDIVVLDSLGKANWDAGDPQWGRAAAIGKSVGLEWGGDWKGFKDLPHFQYTGGLALAKCRALYATGLQSIWSQVT